MLVYRYCRFCGASALSDAQDTDDICPHCEREAEDPYYREVDEVYLEYKDGLR